MVGVRSKNNYLGYIFGSLWTMGFVSVVFLAALVTREFKRQESMKEEVVITSPSNGKLEVDLKPVEGKFYGMVWFDDNHRDRDDMPALSEDEDSMLLNTVRIKIARSQDSGYHAYPGKICQSKYISSSRTKCRKDQLPSITN
jgi:hypothetical protein